MAEYIAYIRTRKHKDGKEVQTLKVRRFRPGLFIANTKEKKMHIIIRDTLDRIISSGLMVVGRFHARTMYQAQYAAEKFIEQKRMPVKMKT